MGSMFRFFHFSFLLYLSLNFIFVELFSSVSGTEHIFKIIITFFWVKYNRSLFFLKSSVSIRLVSICVGLNVSLLSHLYKNAMLFA